MPHALLLVLASLAPADLPTHEKNAVLRTTIDEGLAASSTRVRLPEPTFRDDQSADEQKAALVEIAGSMRGADEMLQASLSAPHRLRLKDEKGDGTAFATGDLYFILQGVDLDAIRPDEAFRQFRGEPTEAGNMRFASRVLKPEESKGLTDAPASDHEWLTHSNGRLLDRLVVESTDRVEASRSADSLIFAARTDPKFGPKDTFPNRWSTLTLKAGGEVLGTPEPYAGGMGYVKMTRLQGRDKAVVVEAHFAFAEPRAWFGGEPILRSKFGLIAQDQVRRIRRELVKSKR